MILWEVYKLKRVLSILILMTLFFSGCNKTSENSNTSSVQTTKFVSTEENAVIKNEYLELTVNSQNGDIEVCDLKNGKKYYSTSPIADDNDWVMGPMRMAFKSQIAINVIDKNGELTTVNSFSGVVREDGFRLLVADNAVCAEYKFVNEKIKLSVEYRLKDNRLVIDIPTSKIYEKGDYSLADINVLPFFAAATPEDEGNLLIPSGSGAIIDFNNSKGDYGEFKQKLYGDDPMDLKEYRTEQGQIILFPMYSMTYKNTDSSVLTYIEDGAALATLNATATNTDSQLTTASFSFNYHPYTLVNPLNTSSQQVKYNRLTKSIAEIDKFSISYEFFDEAKDYVSIANEVKNRLLSQGVTIDDNATDNKLYLELLMGVRKSVYTMGIPRNVCYPLTTISEAEKIADNFDDQSIVMIMNGIDSDGVYGGKIDTGFKIDSNIGNKKQYLSLAEKLVKNGGKLYFVANSTEFTKSKLSYTLLFDGVKSVSGKNLKCYQYRLGDGQQNNEIEAVNLLTHKKISKSVNSIISSAKKSDITAVAPLTLSNSPYTANNAFGDRENVIDIFDKALSDYKSADMDILLSSPIDRFIKYSDNIYSLPVSSSKHKIFDRDIPFIQLVLNGIKNYSIPAANSDNERFMFLKALESGSSLAYSLYDGEFNDIYDTAINDYTGSQFDLLRESLKVQVAEYEKVSNQFEGANIVGYSVISNDVRVTRYSNNKSLFINFGVKDITIDNHFIPAESYVIVQERSD